MKQKWAIITVCAIGVVLGLIGVFSFNSVMAYTGEDSFCLSCHNHAIPYSEYKTTAHFSNAYGVSADCADCHIPHEFIPKLVRKAQAAKEVYAHFAGVIDTDEKYLAHREHMKQKEIARLRANDSAECRNCHDVSRMVFSAQSSIAQEKHKQLINGKTCIDCHQGLVHSPQLAKSEEEFNLDF